jgi:hypothetical protein
MAFGTLIVKTPATMGNHQPAHSVAVQKHSPMSTLANPRPVLNTVMMG